MRWLLSIVRRAFRVCKLPDKTPARQLELPLSFNRNKP